MDVILTNADKIEQMIQEIETVIDAIPEASEDKALGIANYDKELAVTILKMKSGIITEMMDFQGETVTIPSSLAANLLEKIAKGYIWQRSYNKEAGEAGYKGLISILDARKAQLNGLQSINKVLQ